MSPGTQTVSALGVHLHGRRIGVIARLAGEKQIFSLEQEYIDDESRPTLSLSLKGRSGGLVTAIKPVQRRVPPWFSNLLPEGPLRSYLAEKANVNPDREFFLLAALGADLPGAVVVSPLDAPPLEDEGEQPPAKHPDEPTALRFSLAGVQLKFSAIANAAGGLTIPAHGIGGSWIVKLPSPRFPAVAENEFAMLELARAIGIDVPRIRLVPVSAIENLPAEAAALHGQALAVERFDRGPGGARIHMEDFAQVFSVYPENKYKSASYANIAAVLWPETGEPGTFEFIRRLVFSVLIGNGDMHLKNWSLLYPDTRTPTLSPAYDFVSTLPYLPADKLALNFGRRNEMDSVTPTQLRRFAETARLPYYPLVQLVKDTVESTAESWRTLDAKSLLPPEVHAAIHAQIESASLQTSKAFASN